MKVGNYTTPMCGVISSTESVQTPCPPFDTPVRETRSEAKISICSMTVIIQNQ